MRYDDEYTYTASWEQRRNTELSPDELRRREELAAADAERKQQALTDEKQCAAFMTNNPLQLVEILNDFNARYGFGWTVISFQYLPMCKAFVTAVWKNRIHKNIDTSETIRVTQPNTDKSYMRRREVLRQKLQSK